MDFVRPGRGHDANRDCSSSPMAMPIRRRRPLGAASRNRSGIEIVMSPLPMLRLNTRIGGSDSTPTTAFAGSRRCRFRDNRSHARPSGGIHVRAKRQVSSSRMSESRQSPTAGCNRSLAAFRLAPSTALKGQSGAASAASRSDSCFRLQTRCSEPIAQRRRVSRDAGAPVGSPARRQTTAARYAGGEHGRTGAPQELRPRRSRRSRSAAQRWHPAGQRRSSSGWRGTRPSDGACGV